MATLTAAQKEYIRDNSGDDLAESYEVSDLSLQAMWDDTAQGNSDLDRTVVFVLRRRLGKAVRLVSLSGEYGNAQHNQKWEHLKLMLEYWESRTGLTSTGGQSIGSSVTHTYRVDSLATEAPTFDNVDDDNSDFT